jgi:hypothetical protein
MSSREWRYAGAVFLGVVFEAVFLWRFQPYGIRERGPGLVPWYFLPVLALVAGLFLTLGFEGKKRWIPAAMLGSFFAANACLIVADCAEDPTNHNLWPFEFVLIAVATAPAFLGAGISHLVGRGRRQV